MNIANWNHALSPALNKIFDDFLGHDFPELKNFYNPVFNARANIIDEKDQFVIQLAAPGLKKGDFKLKLDKNELTISVETKTDAEGTDKNFTHREFNFDTFKRSFTLPTTADKDNVSAKYKDGILLIAIPKKEEAKEKPAREIKIA